MENKLNFFILFVILHTFWLEQQNGAKAEPTVPPNFPPSMTLQLRPFLTWGRDHNLAQVWTATPQTAEDVVAAVNWAMKNPGCRIRASGYEHTWAPITISKRDFRNSSANSSFSSKQNENGDPPCVILLKTAPNLNKVGVHPSKKTFWAQPGVTMENLTLILEQHDLGFSSIPAVGPITLGGVIAIGGHGASSPGIGEKKLDGHTYGTISNLIVAFTAVVFNHSEGRYELHNFERSDPRAAHLLVNLGRTFLTNVTLRIGPLQRLQCVSRMDVPASELFQSQQGQVISSPLGVNGEESKQLIQRDRSFSHFLQKSGRLEAIVFPYSDAVWLKLWTVADKKPEGAREVKEPYNYPFSDTWPGSVHAIIENIRRGKEHEALNLGTTMYREASKGLKQNRSDNIWGTARNVQLYIRPGTLKATADGYGLITSRVNVQDVVHQFYKHYMGVRGQYQSSSKFPLNGVLEIRVSGLDDPLDCGVEGAQSPAISPANPDPDVNTLGQKYDTIVWFNILPFVTTAELFKAMKAVEDSNGWAQGTGLYRPEWSKGWAYKDDGAWFTERMPALLKDFKTKKTNYWTSTVKVWQDLDPHSIFSNAFLDDLVKVV